MQNNNLKIKISLGIILLIGLVFFVIGYANYVKPSEPEILVKQNPNLKTTVACKGHSALLYRERTEIRVLIENMSNEVVFQNVSVEATASDAYRQSNDLKLLGDLYPKSKIETVLNIATQAELPTVVTLNIQSMGENLMNETEVKLQKNCN